MRNHQQPKKIEIDGWPFRIQEPTKPAKNARVMLLLHGHQGNENAMWILTRPLADDYYLMAPRAPMKVGDHQYSWHEISPQWPGISTYKELAGALLSRTEKWLEGQNIMFSKLDVMGFSQGAIMAYALAFLYPKKMGKVAALAGVLPQGWQDELNVRSLSGRSFFVAHGTQDDIIPIKKAHQTAEWLKKNDAHVTFCEADIGHKLSANCFNGLGEFFG